MNNKSGFDCIIIFGVGFLGGSLALDCKVKKIAKKIIGIDININNLNTALNRKIIDEGYLEIDNKIIANCDLAIICTPLSAYEKVLIDINKLSINNDNLLITDVGSTKRNVIEYFKKFLSKNLLSNAIASHPIAGSEKHGCALVEPNLFMNKKVFITNHKNQSKYALDRISILWYKLGSIIYFLDADKHDYIFSCLSHFPHLLSYIYLEQLNHDLVDHNDIMYAGNGFRDFTRIASSNHEIWTDIFFANKDILLLLIDSNIKELSLFKELLLADDKEKIKEFLLKSILLKDNYYDKKDSE